MSLIDLNLIGLEKRELTPSSVPIKSLSFKETIKGYNVDLDVTLPDVNCATINFLALDNFNVTICVPGINHVLDKLDSHSNLSVSAPKYVNDSLDIQGILGSDALSSFNVFEFCTLLGGRCIRLSNGFIPIGCMSKFNLSFNTDTEKLLCNSKCKSLYSDAKPDVKYGSDVVLPLFNKFDCLAYVADNDDSDTKPNPEVLSTNKTRTRSVRRRKGGGSGTGCEYSFSQCLKPEYSKAVNFVFKEEGRPDHFSPLKLLEQEFDADVGLECLYSLESIGIKSACSAADLDEIDQFKTNITVQNGKYHVKLPWNHDILAKVQPNFDLAKVLAKKVFHKNSSQGINDKYLDVFNEQQKLGIIEEIFPENPLNHVWIPHRPVIREDPLVKTSKVRPVFNCSLKLGGAPSLNEAAYPGIDILIPC